jgi:hypothetical protein
MTWVAAIFAADEDLDGPYRLPQQTAVRVARRAVDDALTALDVTFRSDRTTELGPDNHLRHLGPT